jgi:ribosomal protein S18 acetylase RimI-like enzyme
MSHSEKPLNPAPFVILDQLDYREVEFLDDQLYENSVRVTGINDGRILAIVQRDDQKVITAGLFGYTWGGCCEIRFLWIQETLRRQGLGTRLMAAAESEVISRGARQIVLSTHSFQAPGFYRRLGFEEVGCFEDYPEGHQCIFMRKQLK